MCLSVQNQIAMDRLSFADLQSMYGSSMENESNGPVLSVKSPLTDEKYNVEYNSRVYNSASKVLEQYIKDHEQREAVNLTKSLTKGHSKHALSNLNLQEHNRRRTPNTPEKEIRLARKLFSEEYTNSLKEFETHSMCTDDLILESLNITSELEQNKNMNSARTNISTVCECGRLQQTNFEDTCSNRLQAPSIKPTPVEKSKTATPPYKSHSVSVTEDFDLYSLNGVSYTPHNLKYKSHKKTTPVKQILTMKPESSELKNTHGVKANLSIAHSYPSSTQDTMSIISSPPKLYINRNDPAAKIDTRPLSPTPTDLLIENIVDDYRRRTEMKSNKLENLFSTLPKPILKPEHRKKDTTEQSAVLANAGRTPYKNPGFALHDDVDKYNKSHPSDDELSDSKSHISVSLHLEGKTADVKDFMEDCLSSEFNPSPKKTGTVESLKNMLFTLQSLSSQHSQETLTNDNVDDVSLFSTESYQRLDGHSSIERALQHLNKLSNL